MYRKSELQGLRNWFCPWSICWFPPQMFFIGKTINSGFHFIALHQIENSFTVQTLFVGLFWPHLPCADCISGIANKGTLIMNILTKDETNFLVLHSPAHAQSKLVILPFYSRYSLSAEQFYCGVCRASRISTEKWCKVQWTHVLYLNLVMNRKLLVPHWSCSLREYCTVFLCHFIFYNIHFLVLDLLVRSRHMTLGIKMKCMLICGHELQEQKKMVCSSFISDILWGTLGGKPVRKAYPGWLCEAFHGTIKYHCDHELPWVAEIIYCSDMLENMIRECKNWLCKIPVFINANKFNPIV